MKISIITAVYNCGATIEDTMRSVLSQSHDKIEHVIVDGLSTDNTLEIVESFKDDYARSDIELKVLSEKDHGIYDAMNKGIAVASGEVVGCLNADDFYSSDETLTLIAGAFSDSVDAVYGDLILVDAVDTDKILRKWVSSDYKPFKRGWHPAHPTFYARRSCFEAYGNFNLSLAVSADFELMLRFIERYQIGLKYIPETLVTMRHGGESTGSIKNILRGNINIMKAFKINNIPVNPIYPVLRLFPKVIQVVKEKVLVR